MTTTEERVHQDNLRLGQIEYLLQRIHLWSLPRCLGLVLGNACNIDCVHCYQAKNGDNLLRPPEIASALRREFSALYPYLSTLRVQGGEVFAIRGFRELVEDVAGTVRRPILSISTNGTMITEEWAERIVSLPFSNVTVSIDGARPATFAQLRKGGDLRTVLANIQRIQRWKEKLGSALPHLDSFFVVMRSNFREIPEYFELMAQHGIADLSLQTVEINRENTGRVPALEHDQLITAPSEVSELHRLLSEALPHYRPRFRQIRFSGLQTLFEKHGLSSSFLEEGANGLYPDSDELQPDSPSFELCPNPWTTMFITEDGNAHLCFLALPIGNIYETPIVSLWNSQRAMEKRSHMIAGRYMASGCSEQWCSWREGQTCQEQKPEDAPRLLAEMRQLTDQALQGKHPGNEEPNRSSIASVRRMMTSRGRQVAELQVLFQQLCNTNTECHERGQQHIDHLEEKLRASQQGAHTLEEKLRALQQEFNQFRQRRSVQLAVKASETWRGVVRRSSS